MLWEKYATRMGVERGAENAHSAAAAAVGEWARPPTQARLGAGTVDSVAGQWARSHGVACSAVVGEGSRRSTRTRVRVCGSCIGRACGGRNGSTHLFCSSLATTPCAAEGRRLLRDGGGWQHSLLSGGCGFTALLVGRGPAPRTTRKRTTTPPHTASWQRPAIGETGYIAAARQFDASRHPHFAGPRPTVWHRPLATLPPSCEGGRGSCMNLSRPGHARQREESKLDDKYCSSPRGKMRQLNSSPRINRGARAHCWVGPSRVASSTRPALVF